MAGQWHYFVGGKKHGPVSWQRLKELVAIGVVQPTSEVWKEDAPDWVIASDVPELCGTMNAAASKRGSENSDTQAVSPDDTSSSVPRQVNGSAAKGRQPLLYAAAGALVLALIGVGVFLIMKGSKQGAKSDKVEAPKVPSRSLFWSRHSTIITPAITSWSSRHW